MELIEKLPGAETQQAQATGAGSQGTLLSLQPDRTRQPAAGGLDPARRATAGGPCGRSPAAPKAKGSPGSHRGGRGPPSPGRLASLAIFPCRMLFCIVPQAFLPNPQTPTAQLKGSATGRRPAAWPGTRRHSHPQEATLGADAAKPTAFHFFFQVLLCLPPPVLPLWAVSPFQSS